LLTDGVYSVSDPQGTRFSFDQLVKGLEGVRAATPEALIEAALVQARSFAQDGPFDDDVALVAIRRE